MKTLLEKSMNLALIAVLTSLVASLAVFLLGLVETIQIIINIASHLDESSTLVVAFISVMDMLLVAVALLIFAVSIYELFIGDLALPTWLVVHNFDGLKTKLSGVIILVLAVNFTKHLVEWEDPQGTLFFGIAVAVVSSALVIFNRTADKRSGKDQPVEVE